MLSDYQQNGHDAGMRMPPIPPERELIMRAINGLHPKNHVGGSTPRWVLVKNLFCCGSTMANRICFKYGFDPEQDVF